MARLHPTEKASSLPVGTVRSGRRRQGGKLVPAKYVVRRRGQKKAKRWILVARDKGAPARRARKAAPAAHSPAAADARAREQEAAAEAAYVPKPALAGGNPPWTQADVQIALPASIFRSHVWPLYGQAYADILTAIGAEDAGAGDANERRAWDSIGVLNRLLKAYRKSTSHANKTRLYMDIVDPPSTDLPHSLGWSLDAYRQNPLVRTGFARVDGKSVHVGVRLADLHALANGRGSHPYPYMRAGPNGSPYFDYRMVAYYYVQQMLGGRKTVRASDVQHYIGQDHMVVPTLVGGRARWWFGSTSTGPAWHPLFSRGNSIDPLSIPASDLQAAFRKVSASGDTAAYVADYLRKLKVVL